MKVIDLLNKIAKGEEIPKKILCDGIVYTYNPKQGDYYEIDSPISLFLYENFGNSPNTKIWLLSDNIEILEDTTEEIKEIEYYEINGVGDEHDKYVLSDNQKYICGAYNDPELVTIRKINELVRAVNKLNKQDTSKETNCMSE